MWMKPEMLLNINRLVPRGRGGAEVSRGRGRSVL